MEELTSTVKQNVTTRGGEPAGGDGEPDRDGGGWGGDDGKPGQGRIVDTVDRNGSLFPILEWGSGGEGKEGKDGALPSGSRRTRPWSGGYAAESMEEQAHRGRHWSVDQLGDEGRDAGDGRPSPSPGRITRRWAKPGPSNVPKKATCRVRTTKWREFPSRPAATNKVGLNPTELRGTKMRTYLPVTNNEYIAPAGTSLVSKTDRKGIITKPRLQEVSGFTRDESGRLHNLVRHPTCRRRPSPICGTRSRRRPGPVRGRTAAKNGDHHWYSGQRHADPRRRPGDGVGAQHSFTRRGGQGEKLTGPSAKGACRATRSATAQSSRREWARRARWPGSRRGTHGARDGLDIAHARGRLRRCDGRGHVGRTGHRRCGSRRRSGGAVGNQSIFRPWRHSAGIC